MRKIDDKLLNFIDIATLCGKKNFNFAYANYVIIFLFSEDQFCDFVSYYNTNLLVQYSLSLITTMRKDYPSC